MKKLIALLLALMMIFALAACNEDSPDPDNDDPLNRNSQTDDQGGTQGGEDNSGTQEGVIIKGGPVGNPAPAHSFPQNLKFVVDSTVYAIQSTVIKLGNDYMFISLTGVSDILVDYYKASGDDEWLFYQMGFGANRGNEGVWTAYGTRTWEDLEDILYRTTPLAHHTYGLDISAFSSTGESQVIAGVTVRGYTVDWGGTEETFWLSDDGFVFMNTYAEGTCITEWNTTVTSFPYDVSNVPPPETEPAETEPPTVPDDAPMTWTKAEVSDDKVSTFAGLTYNVPEPNAAYTVTNVSASLGLTIRFESDADVQAWKQVLADAGFSQGSTLYQSTTHMVIFSGLNATIGFQ